MKNMSAIKLLHNLRRVYEAEQKFHYMTFAILSLLLMLDFIIIIYTKAVTLNAYAWSGIILLFTLIAVEGQQYRHYTELIESVDDFYLKGEYRR